MSRVNLPSEVRIKGIDSTVELPENFEVTDIVLDPTKKRALTKLASDSTEWTTVLQGDAVLSVDNPQLADYEIGAIVVTTEGDILRRDEFVWTRLHAREPEEIAKFSVIGAVKTGTQSLNVTTGQMEDDLNYPSLFTRSRFGRQGSADDSLPLETLKSYPETSVINANVGIVLENARGLGVHRFNNVVGSLIFPEAEIYNRTKDTAYEISFSTMQTQTYYLAERYDFDGTISEAALSNIEDEYDLDNGAGAWALLTEQDKATHIANTHAAGAKWVAKYSAYGHQKLSIPFIDGTGPNGGNTEYYIYIAPSWNYDSDGILTTNSFLKISVDPNSVPVYLNGQKKARMYNRTKWTQGATVWNSSGAVDAYTFVNRLENVRVMENGPTGLPNQNQLTLWGFDTDSVNSAVTSIPIDQAFLQDVAGAKWVANAQGTITLIRGYFNGDKTTGLTTRADSDIVYYPSKAAAIAAKAADGTINLTKVRYFTGEDAIMVKMDKTAWSNQYTAATAGAAIDFSLESFTDATEADFIPTRTPAEVVARLDIEETDETGAPILSSSFTIGYRQKAKIIAINEEDLDSWGFDIRTDTVDDGESSFDMTGCRFLVSIESI